MHDKNGRPLAVGDRVTVTATIKELYSGEEFCNLQLETEEAMWPAENKTIITLNARQVEKLLEEDVSNRSDLRLRAPEAEASLKEIKVAEAEHSGGLCNPITGR